MGQEIFYCGTCKTLLRSRDLEKGDAFRLDDRVYCKACAAAVLGSLPVPVAKPAEPELGDTTRTRLGASGRTPRSGVHPTTSSKSPTGLILAGVGGGVLLLILFALAMSGGSKAAPKVERPPDPPVVIVEPAYRAPEPPLPRPEPRPNPKPPSRDASSQRLIEEVRNHLTAAPEDLDGALERVRRALLEASGTTFEPEARRLDEDVRRRLKERTEKRLAEVEARAKEAVAAERFGEAIAFLEAAKKFSPDAAEARLAETRWAADKAWAEAREKLLQARKRGAEPEVKLLTARIEAWGLEPIRAELRTLLAGPVAVEPPAEVLAYRKRWTEPWAVSTPFDAAAALRELEKPAAGAAKAEAEADLEALRLAADVAREIPLLLQRLPKGQELRLERFHEGWGRSEVSGRLYRHGIHELELLAGEEILAVGTAELTPACLAELYRARPAKRPSDARAGQVYCLLEGDVEGAQRHGTEPLPANVAALAARLVRDMRSPSETAARKLFLDAEREHRDGALRLSSSPHYAALLKDPGVFARRARPLIEDRLQSSQETFLTGSDLQGAGLFVPTEALKGAACLSMAADAPAGRASDNYVQMEPWLPGGEAVVRCWIYAGACCAETFAFGFQAAELKGPNPKDPKETVGFDPAGPFAMPVKPPSMLRPKHAAHGGPKEASKWAWVSLLLPKYTTPGPRRIRLVAEHQGFSVAYAWFGVGRPGPPRDADLKELERVRAALDALLGPAPVQLGTLHREVWLNVPGSKIPDLLSAPGFPDRPSSAGPISSFEGPPNVAENYGSRIRGYLHPPATGDYVFFAATDDDSELWLSSDEMPSRKRKLGGVSGATKPRGWEDPLAFKSGPIPLKAGKRYYVELIHKEGSLEDCVAVGWQLPDGSMERPIPGHRLSPVLAGGRAPRPGLYRAINLNGLPLTIDGQPWEGKDAQNLTFAGENFENQTVPLDPPVEGPKAQMIRSSIINRQGAPIVVSGVPSGRYQVYCYVWEDNGTQTFDLLLNGRVVREKYSSGGPGHWEKLGPWPLDVTDGRIELRTTPADANISGLEIWRNAR